MKVVFKKIDKFILDTLERVLALFVVVVGFLAMLAALFAIPITIIVAALRQDWHEAFIRLVGEVVAIFIWRVCTRLALKLTSLENKH